MISATGTIPKNFKQNLKVYCLNENVLIETQKAF